MSLPCLFLLVPPLRRPRNQFPQYRLKPPAMG